MSTTSWAAIAKSAGTAAIKSMPKTDATTLAAPATERPVAHTPLMSDVGQEIRRCPDRYRIIADKNKPMFWGMCPASWSRPEMTDQQLIDSWQSGAGRGLLDGLFDVLCDKPMWPHSEEFDKACGW